MKQKNILIMGDLEVAYEIVRRKVKYPRLEIKDDLLFIIVLSLDAKLGILY